MKVNAELQIKQSDQPRNIMYLNWFQKKTIGFFCESIDCSYQHFNKNRFKSREGERDLHTMFLYCITHNLSYIQSQNNLWIIHCVINNKLQKQTHQRAYLDTIKTTHLLWYTTTTHSQNTLWLKIQNTLQYSNVNRNTRMNRTCYTWYMKKNTPPISLFWPRESIYQSCNLFEKFWSYFL